MLGWLRRLSVRFLVLAQVLREFETRIKLCADGMEPAWDSLSPFLSAPPVPLKNKQTLKKMRRDREAK